MIMDIIVDRNAGPVSVSLQCSFLIYGTVGVVKYRPHIRWGIVTDLHISNSNSYTFCNDLASCFWYLGS